MAANVAETLSILSAPTSVTPEAVAANIDGWKAELQALGPSGHSISADLDALKAALAAGEDVGPILTKLGHATITVADNSTDLQQLGTRLTSFGS